MKIALLLFFVFVAVAPQPGLPFPSVIIVFKDSRGGRRFQSEPTYSPETPFRDNVPAPVFGAGHNKSPFNQRYWPEETSRYQSPWVYIDSKRCYAVNLFRNPRALLETSNVEMVEIQPRRMDVGQRLLEDETNGLPK